MSTLENQTMVTGVDIGGTHITACRVDLNENHCIQDSMVRHHLDASADADTIVACWASAIREARQDHQDRCIGIAMPGPFDYENGISYMKNLNKYDKLYGINVKEKLAVALQVPVENIRFVNDATAFLLGEKQQLSGNNFSLLLGVTLGTGLGSAWSKNGKMEEGDLYCFPFRDGVAEDYVSARWLIREYALMTGREVSGVREISQQASSGDKAAKELFEIFGQSLAEVIYLRFAPAIPQHIIFGGNISLASDHFIHAFHGFLQDRVPVPSHSVSVLGESAALIGAACLWK